MIAMRTWWGQLLVVLLAIVGMEIVIWLLPSLIDTPVAPMVLREVLLIGWALALMLWLARNGPVSTEALGWKKPGWRTLGWGLVCLLVTVLASAVLALTLRYFGEAQDHAVLSAMSGKPVWMLILIAMTAAISEEIVFRGIVLNYLAKASGSQWFGAFGSLAIFALAHANGWGWSHVPFAAVPGAILTVFFLWKRDLGICILAHFLADTFALLTAAALFHHP